MKQLANRQIFFPIPFWSSSMCRYFWSWLKWYLIEMIRDGRLISHKSIMFKTVKILFYCGWFSIKIPFTAILKTHGQALLSLNSPILRNAWISNKNIQECEGPSSKIGFSKFATAVRWKWLPHLLSGNYQQILFVAELRPLVMRQIAVDVLLSGMVLSIGVLAFMRSLMWYCFETAY